MHGYCQRQYNGVKAITHFIHAGDKVIANNDEDNNMTATSDDGETDRHPQLRHL